MIFNDWEWKFTEKFESENLRNEHLEFSNRTANVFFYKNFDEYTSQSSYSLLRLFSRRTFSFF